MPAFGNLIPRLRRPFGGLLSPLPFRGEPFGMDEGPYTGGARFQPLANVNEGLTPFNPPPAAPGPSLPNPVAPRPAAPAMPQMPAPQSPAVGPQRRPGLLGQLGGLDPLTLAMFMAPIAEILKHGSGSALYSAALQGKAQREEMEERRAERERVLQERADAKAAGDKDREEDANDRKSRRTAELLKMYAGTNNPAARAAIRQLPGAEGIDFDAIDRGETPEETYEHPDYPGVRLNKAQFLQAQRDTVNRNNRPGARATGEETPAKRMDRIRADLSNLARSGVNDPATRQRIKQLAAITGVDPRVYLAQLDAAAKDRGVRTANVQARTNRANRPPVRGGGRGRATTKSPLSKFYN